MMSLRLSDNQVLHNIASSSIFFNFAQIFSLFLLVFCTSKLLEFKEFSRTFIPFAFVGYAPRWLFTIPYPMRTHGIIVKLNLSSCKELGTGGILKKCRTKLDCLILTQNQILSAPDSLQQIYFILTEPTP